MNTYSFSSKKYLKLMFGILRDELQEKGYEVELKNFREGAAPGRIRKAEYFLSNPRHIELKLKFNVNIGKQVAQAEVLDVRDYAGFIVIPEQFVAIGRLRIYASNKPAQFSTDTGICYETTITGFRHYTGDYFVYYSKERFHLIAKCSVELNESYLFCSSLAQYEGFALPERITRNAAALHYDAGETLLGLASNLEVLYFHAKQNTISVTELLARIVLFS